MREKKNKAQIKAVKRATSAEYYTTKITYTSITIKCEYRRAKKRHARHIYECICPVSRDKNLSSLSHAKYTCVRVYT